MTIEQTDAPATVKTVALTIDGVEVNVPEGTLVIRAAEELGIQIPRFCDHPLLDPVGACRQCLVDVSMPDREGNLRPMPKPQASCTLAVAEGMQVKTQHTSEVADKAQKGVMELLLVNHPLDCPVCDKGGECPLQNQAMSNGYAESRFVDIKRTFPKPINISSQVLLDRERCVLCARCTRFSNEIAGDPFIALIERGALQQVGIYEEQPFESYFSGNTVQICPVGALTGAAYRFRSRPFDLVSTPSVCEHCAGGCSLRVDHRRGSVLRRMALEDPAVNEEWNCDKGRWAFAYAGQPDRLRDPVVRGADGQYQVVSWEVALRAAAAGLSRASSAGSGTGVLVGGRVSVEDAYGYSKFARLALGTNDVDFRSRPQSAEEADFLASSVVGTTEVTYTALEEATSVLLVGLEAEEESASTFLRLRKAVRKRGLKVSATAPFATRGLRKLDGTLLSAAPGTEAEVLISLAGGGIAQSRVDLGPTSVILVGERLATSPGALTAAVKLARSTGASLAWMPRRAGDRGALEAGALPNLLPGGRPVDTAAARAEVAAVWGAPVPEAPGRDTDGIVAAAAAGELSALLVGGVDPDDLPDPVAARAALQRAFVVSLDFRESAVHEYADVILPIVPQQEKAGTFINWEGRERQFQQALESNGRSDHAMLDLIAAELGIVLGLRSLTETRREITRLGGWDGVVPAPGVAPVGPAQPGPGEAVLATWTHLLDLGSLQEGEPFLAGTARRTVARLSATTATAIGAVDGEPVTVSSARGQITVPLVVTDMPDHVVWVPTNSRGSQVRPSLGALAGDLVRIAPGPAATEEPHTKSAGGAA